MAELADRLQEYGVSLDFREMYEAACNADAEAVDITRELCQLHPDKHNADLQTAFKHSVPRSIAERCMRLHAMLMPKPLILPASSANFIQENTIPNSQTASNHPVSRSECYISIRKVGKVLRRP